jgi:hypothetical protein
MDLTQCIANLCALFSHYSIAIDFARDGILLSYLHHVSAIGSLAIYRMEFVHYTVQTHCNE